MADLLGLIDSEQPDVAVSWGFVAVLVGATIVTLLRGELLWTGLALVAIAVALVPTVLSRDATVIAAWEPLLVTTAPIVAHVLGVFAEPAGYVAVAGLALLVAVEITAFSEAEMTPTFAVGFVTMTTMSAAAVWNVARYYSDALLGTSFLAGHADLMWNLVGATVVGIGAGLVFELYFQRQQSGRTAVLRG